MKTKTFRKKLLEKASAKETFRESFIKAQSALEYLMTYGWAIIIIAVVLAALVNLGVFTPSPPTAIPGSCQVVRTSQGPELLGVCGALPKYVEQFNDWSQQNYLFVNNVNVPGLALTITAWMKVYRGGGVVDIGYGNAYTGSIGTWQALIWNYSGWSYPFYVNYPPINTGQWYFVTLRPVSYTHLTLPTNREV